MSIGQATEQDDDSESENLSPLLYHKNKKSQVKHVKKIANSSAAATATTQFQTTQLQTPLHIDGVNVSIDDTDTDLEQRDIEVILMRRKKKIFFIISDIILKNF